jgi:hypothetical protein
MGRYSLTTAVHRGPSHLERCFHWWESACTFEVADSVAEPFQGRIRLHVEARAEPIGPSSQLVTSDVTGGSLVLAATLGRRNAALRDFRARLASLDVLNDMRRGADGLMTFDITNSGGESWGAYGRQPVHVSHRWLARDGATLMFDGLRTALPYDVAPGQTLRLRCFFRAPDTEGEERWYGRLCRRRLHGLTSGNPRLASCSVFR